MGLKRGLTLTLTALVVLVIATLILGQVLGQPLLLSFVETGSMEPTISSGDGFVVVPSGIAGEVSVGDIILFDAEEIEGGGYVTHRVVGETERGYITRGDANPFTDQDSTEPPVRDPQIAGKVLGIGGSVVVIPHLGTAVTGFQNVLTTIQRELASLFGLEALLGPEGIGFLFFGLMMLAAIIDYLITGPASDRDRSRSRDRSTGISTRLVLISFSLLIVGAATAAMLGPGGTQTYGIVSAEFESERPTVIQTGETDELTYATANSGFIPVYVYLEPVSDGIQTEPRRHYIDPGSETNATITLSAPEETGYYREFMTQHRYLAVLPGEVIHALHEFHPWAALLAINAFLGGAFYGLGAILIGTSGRVRIRKRSRSRSGRRGYQLLRSLY